MLSVTDFDPKRIISGVRVQAGLYLDMLDADRSPNAVSVHAGTSQVDFEVDRPPPAPLGHLLITMVKEAVFCTKNEFRKMKKSRISHWSESDFFFFSLLKSRLQSHFVVVNCGVFWWWDQHTLPTWGLGFAMCLVHQVLPTARGVPGWSPIQVLTPLDGAWLRWSDGNRYVTAAWP